MGTQRTIVLITGANQGIGYEVAKLLLSSQESYYILLGSRDMTRGAEAAAILNPTGASVEPVTIDVSDDASIEQAVDYVASKHGHIDVLINNAGINNELSTLLQQKKDQEESNSDAAPGSVKMQEKTKLQGPRRSDLTQLRKLYHDAYEINVFGAAATTEAFLPLLTKAVASPPRIVFVSSHAGSMGLRSEQSSGIWKKLRSPSFPIYRSTKAALNMLTLHYAALFEEQGWMVNASAPNLTATNFSRGIGRPASESAVNIVRLATLSAGGATGTYSDENGAVPW
jgi:NAD(P)-dependent dehydrogenase (short-subunit alcohol dehydrogenase family)